MKKMLARLGKQIAEDARDVQILASAVAKVARGDDLALPLELWDAVEAAPHPLGPIRRWRGVTQQALAAEAGVAQAYVSEVETGTKAPSRRVLDRLAAALRVPAGHLVVGDD